MKIKRKKDQLEWVNVIKEKSLMNLKREREYKICAASQEKKNSENEKVRNVHQLDERKEKRKQNNNKKLIKNKKNIVKTTGAI